MKQTTTNGPAFTITERTTTPLLKAEKPWESMAISWFSVIRDAKGWRMWYGAWDKTYRNDNDTRLCYATSDDGVHWTRPNLGLVEFEGSKSNNILFDGRMVGGFAGQCVFLDPGAPAAERYKMAFIREPSGSGGWFVHGAVSADGLRWTILPEPLLKKNSDTQQVCFWDGDRYRLYVRMWSGADSGMYDGKRQVGHTESKTFGTFPDPKVILEPDAQDSADLHFYNSAASRLRNDLYIQFPSAYHTNDHRVRPHLAMSRDGQTFVRIGREPVLPFGKDGSFDSKSIYVAPGAVPGDRPNTWWIYYAGFNLGHEDKMNFSGGYGRFLLEIKDGGGKTGREGTREGVFRSMSTRELFNGLPGATPAEKVARIQALYDRAAFGPSGIMYSMQRLADGEVRPFQASDFTGMLCINAEKSELKLDGPWDYLHGENSITHSGIYLAAQAYRIQVEDTAEAREQAEKAFRSLELIYEMGVKGGQPGWMCKPYGFRPSNQTSPDQYLDACWGLYAYHAVAPADHRRKIEEMVVGFADYWRRADYRIVYFGNKWSIDQEGYGNATLVLINALAHHYTGRQAYLDEARRLLGRADWQTGTAVTKWRARLEEERRTGRLAPHNETAIPFATPLLKPGEVFFWEAAIHCKFVAVAAEILQDIQPDLLGARLPRILEMWWEQGRYGTGDDLLPYYWFAADFLNGTSRPLPNTPLLPREQWAFGDPFMGCINQVRWNEPLARSIVTSVIACRHAPAVAAPAGAMARRIMDALDETRLHWMVDPDGKQLPPEIRYYGQCLSSEMGASFLAAYWRGRKDGLWK